MPLLRSRRLLGALGATAAVLALAGSAAAIPVEKMKVWTDGDQVRFTADLISPRQAKSCQASVHASLRKNRAPDFPVVKEVNGTINVCRTGKRGVTKGFLKGNFGVSSVPAGSYGVCITARQTLRTGAVSRDSRCKIFTL
jgi:hypothetical protein